jgi:hydrogenase/urease accessory protein HupE
MRAPFHSIAAVAAVVVPAAAHAHEGHVHDGGPVHALLHLFEGVDPLVASLAIGVAGAVALVAVLRRVGASRRQRPRN